MQVYSTRIVHYERDCVHVLSFTMVCDWFQVPMIPGSTGDLSTKIQTSGKTWRTCTNKSNRFTKIFTSTSAES